MIKRVISIALALCMLVGIAALMPTTAKAAEYTAKLGYSTTGWDVSEWGDNVYTTVSGDGTYTLSWDVGETAAYDAGVFVIDIAGAQADLSAEGKTYNVTALTVTVDGNDVPVDVTKLITGDIEENGNFRIEIYNQYGAGTAENPPLDAAALVINTNLTVTFTIETVDLGGESEAPATEFNTTLGFANSDWSAQEWGENVNTVVTGDGTYTLSWDGAASDALVFVVDIAGAQAALSAENKTYNLTALTVTADGVEVPVDLSKVVTGDIEENGNWRIEIYNEYGTTKEAAPVDPAAVTFATNLTVTFTIETVDVGGSEPAGEYLAAMGLVASDWSTTTDFREASTVQTTVTGEGTYTLTYEGACADLGILVVDVVGAAGVLELDSLTLTIDGSEVAVDMSKVLTGDLEENGNWRIDLQNMYGDSAADPAIDPTLSVAESLVLTFTVKAATQTDAPVETEPVETEPAATFDPNGSYNAYLLLQTPNWTYRDSWNDANGVGSEYWGNFIYGNETGETYGVVTDAVVAGNGTYSVTITDFGSVFSDDFTTAGQDYFNIIGLSTDIPLSEDVKITDVKLIIDGKPVHKYGEAYLDPDVTDYCKILIQNIWNPDVKEISYYAAPTTSLEIQFTISGFAYDNAEQGNEETQAPTQAPTQTDAPAGDNTGSEGGNNMTGIIIAVVAAVAVVVVVVVVLKKKKA